jgi:dihydroorotate dehydrogenase (fumarate)
MRLHWLAILFGHVDAELAVTGGVHTAKDLVKCSMAGASAVQVVSAVLKQGPTHIRAMLVDLRQWLSEHEYQSIEQLRGSMSLLKCPDPAQYVRDNYMQVLHSWKD